MEQTTNKSEESMLDIWFFVGLLLSVYGVIITLAGVYYIFNPQTAFYLHELNPSLWWGLIMLVSGLIFLITSIRRRSRYS